MAAGKGGKKGSGKAAEKGGDKGAKGAKSSAKGGQEGGKGGEKGSSRFVGKPYKAALEDVLACTKVRPADFDQKAVQLLDYHESHSQRAAAALKYLKDVAVGVNRDDILNSRAYVYALLRKFDENAYHDMKAATGGEKPVADRDRGRSDRKEKTERPAAVGDASTRAPGDASSRQPLAPPPLQDYLTQVGFFGAKQPPPAPAHEALDLNPEAPEFDPNAAWSGRLVGATPAQPSLPPFPYGYYPGAAYPPAPYGQPAPYYPPPPYAVPPAYPGYGYPAAGTQPGYPPYPPPDVPADSVGVKKGSKGGRRRGEGKGDRGGKDGEKADGKDKGDKNSDATAAAGGQPSVESIGSKGHYDQECKPCAFYHTKGCSSGANCQFCHLCGPGEKKKRKKITGEKTPKGAEGAEKAADESVGAEAVSP